MKTIGFRGLAYFQTPKSLDLQRPYFLAQIQCSGWFFDFLSGRVAGENLLTWGLPKMLPSGVGSIRKSGRETSHWTDLVMGQ